MCGWRSPWKPTRITAARQSRVQCGELRLVTFDQGFSRFKGLELLILKAEEAK